MKTGNTNPQTTVERASQTGTLPRLFNACLLGPADVPPSQPDMEVIGVFNPGVIETDTGVVLVVRVAEQTRERREGFTALPRWEFEEGRIVVDWERNEDVTPVDIRVIRIHATGLVRLNFTSHLRVVHSADGRRIDSVDDAVFRPANLHEEFGVEDPRITAIGDVYYMTYVAVSQHGVSTALASTRDFKTFQRHGIIFPPENKDVVLFPEKIGGEYWALHRPNGATPFTRPKMWVATSPDLIHWGRQEKFFGGTELWDIGRIGAGTPPIRTPEGWLEIYHGNSKRTPGVDIGTYVGALLLLDRQDPRRILGRSGAVFAPETRFESEGFVPQVVFPTGVVDRGKTLLVYYGAADTFTAVVEFSWQDVLGTITRVA